MANDNVPSGFTPWGPLLTVRSFSVAGSDLFPTFIGDVMGLLDTGYVTAVAGGSTLICGSSLSFVTGSVAGTVRVACDPNQLFWAQDTSAAGTLTITHCGGLTDHLYAAGSLSTKRSKTVLNSGTNGWTAAAAGWELIGLHDRTNSDGTLNAYSATSPKVVVIAGEHHFKAAIAGGY